MPEVEAPDDELAVFCWELTELELVEDVDDVELVGCKVLDVEAAESTRTEFNVDEDDAGPFELPDGRLIVFNINI